MRNIWWRLAIISLATFATILMFDHFEETKIENTNEYDGEPYNISRHVFAAAIAPSVNYMFANDWISIINVRISYYFYSNTYQSLSITAGCRF